MLSEVKSCETSATANSEMAAAILRFMQLTREHARQLQQLWHEEDGNLASYYRGIFATEMEIGMRLVGSCLQEYNLNGIVWRDGEGQTHTSSLEAFSVTYDQETLCDWHFSVTPSLVEDGELHTTLDNVMGFQSTALD